MNIKHKCKMYKKIQNINIKYKIYIRIKKQIKYPFKK